MTRDTLPFAVRVYPVASDATPRKSSTRVLARPKVRLVFDTETRTDATQALTFGSYRFIVEGKCLEEGLFYADDLSSAERAVLESYVSTHAPDVDPDEGVPELQLLRRTQFLDKFYDVAYETRALNVGFNLPFDLSRLAHDVAPARRDMVGGFSLGLWSYTKSSGPARRDPFRPRLAIKHIDSKRALTSFKGRHQPGDVDRIPESSTTGAPDPKFIFYGNFLDLRRLAYALTDRAYTLKDACEAFGVAHGKVEASYYGVVTEAYIDYNRRDVLATAELADKLLEEFDRHPIPMRATAAFSSASIGRAYLRAMGICPILERQPDLPPRFLGYAQSAFFGGRTSAHIRNVPVPVVYTDFLSMYPTVNGLLNVWAFVVAARIEVVKHCQDEIATLLQRLTLDDVFRPETWTQLTAFVRLVPDGDVLPARCQYGSGHDWQVGVNHIHASSDDLNDALWFALPDVVASVLLTGKVPRIVDAFRLVPVGQQDGLQPTRLRGEISIDPRAEDFFRKVIEERKRLGRRKDVTAGSTHLDRSLKILANAASYGIYAEMRRDDDPAEVSVRCHGIDADPFQCDVVHPDRPGECAFPPLAAITTSAARLMLATLERCVTDRGGTYAMEDTDSMAIVATTKGGAVPCPGADRDTIRALSWRDVDAIVDRFAQLNPYDRSVVPGSILKVEDDNFDPTTHDRRQLHCVAISAKRYGLFVLDDQGEPALLRRGLNNHDDGGSEHGLGHLLNPIDPESPDRGWISQVWTSIIRKAMKLPTDDLPFSTRPAVGKITISSPAVLKPFAALNDGKPYAAQLKPFNFLVGTHVRALGHPVGVSPERFHLIAPYERDPTKWLGMDWIDQYSERVFKIRTRGQHGSRVAARVKTYGEVVAEYETHPEAKCADRDGLPCTRQTVGLFRRRHVRMGVLRYIGKESNAIEDVDAGLVHAATDVYTEYPDPRRDEWRTSVVPALKRIPLKVFERLTGKPRKMLIAARRGHRELRRENRELLIAVARRLQLL